MALNHFIIFAEGQKWRSKWKFAESFNEEIGVLVTRQNKSVSEVGSLRAA